jgi:uncharacterized membrane protein YgdD (TMEM256/DUF423 family)
MNWTVVGAVFMALAVGMGAFGAHALKERLDEYSQSVYEKAVFYHFIHGIGILLISLLARAGVLSVSGAERAGWLMALGIVLFSGSLYALALSGVRILGAVTPFGGVAFIVGWVLLAYEATRGQQS